MIGRRARIAWRMRGRRRNALLLSWLFLFIPVAFLLLLIEGRFQSGDPNELWLVFSVFTFLVFCSGIIPLKQIFLPRIYLCPGCRSPVSPVTIDTEQTGEYYETVAYSRQATAHIRDYSTGRVTGTVQMPVPDGSRTYLRTTWRDYRQCPACGCRTTSTYTR